jgi:hypothetical protein
MGPAVIGVTAAAGAAITGTATVGTADGTADMEAVADMAVGADMAVEADMAAATDTSPGRTLDDRSQTSLNGGLCMG